MRVLILTFILLASGCEAWEARVSTESDHAGKKITDKSRAFSEEGCNKKLSILRDQYEQRGVTLYHWECQIISCLFC